MKTHRIAVIPGDGIGPEVVDIGLEIMNKIAKKKMDLRLPFDIFPLAQSII